MVTEEKDRTENTTSPDTSLPRRHGAVGRGGRGPSLLGSCKLVLAIIFISVLSVGLYESTGPWRPPSQQLRQQQQQLLLLQQENQQQQQQQQHEPPEWQATLETLMSPETTESLLADQQLRRSLGFAIDFTTSLTRDLGAKYDLPSLRETGDKLAEVRRGLGKMETWSSVRFRKRQLFGGGRMPGLFVGEGARRGGGAAAAAAAFPPGAGGLLWSQLGSGMLNELKKPLKEAFVVIKDKLLQNTGGATFFLGVGLGGGVAEGLNFTDGPGARRLMDKVAADNGQSATGLNPAIENLGLGMTATLTAAINITELGTNVNLSQILKQVLGDRPLSEVALALSNGLGSGAAKGLNLGNSSQLVAPRGSSISDAAGALGFGLTNSITSALKSNESVLLLPDIQSFNLTGLLGNQTLAQVARMLADGIGSGAAKGLNISNTRRARLVEAPQGTSAADVAGAFGFGLTESLTRSFDGSNSMPFNLDVQGTLKKTFPGLKVGSVIQGFARGFLQGAGDSIVMMGGIEAIMNGTAVIPTVFPNETIAFNDTLGGAGTGLGQGVGGQGVIVAAELIARQFPDSLKIPGVGNRTIATRPLLNKRALAPATLRARADGNGAVHIGPGFNLSAIVNAGTVSNATQTIIDVLQCEGIGGLFLIGVGLMRGGAISTNPMSLITGGGGNIESSFGLNKNVTNTLRQVIPNDTISFHSRGNFYEIDGGSIQRTLDGSVNNAIDGIKVNGLKIIPFIVLLLFHIILALIVFIGMLPIALCLESARNILARMSTPYLALPRKTSQWIGIMYAYVIAPSLVLVFIFGAVIAGSRQDQFRNAHSILGLLSVLFGLPAIALYWTDTRLPVARARVLAVLARDINTATFRMALTRALSNQLFQSITIATMLSGFAEVSGVSLCATQAVPFEGALSIGFLLASISSAGMMLNWLDFYMAWNISRISKALKTPDMSGSDTSDTSDADEGAVAASDKQKQRVSDPEKKKGLSPTRQISGGGGGGGGGLFYPEKSLVPQREEGSFFFRDDRSQQSISPDLVSYVTVPSQNSEASPSGVAQTD